MKKFLLGTVAMMALGAGTPVFAADMAARPYTKAPPMVAAAYDWSGFYVGINGGWAQSNDGRTLTTVPLFLGSYDADGGTVGGQIGYRWQSAGWVFGVEAQGNWADLSGGTQNLGNPANSLRSHMDAFGLFTGQIGYSWNNLLLYVKGGAAVTDRRYEFVSNLTGAAVASVGYDTRWSPTVGAGVEFSFAPGWSVGVEYNHIFEDRHNTLFYSTATGLPVNGGAIYNTGGDTDMILGRLNYRFGGPMIARY